MKAEILKEKFFKGESTIEEEIELRRMIEEDSDLPHAILADKELLLSLLPHSSKTPAGLGYKLSHMIDLAAGNAAQQSGTKARVVAGPKRAPITIPKYIWHAILSAAAVIAIACLLRPGDKEPKDTFSTPEEAAIHIDETLTLFAMAFNSGIENEREVATQLSSIQATINDNINSIIFK